MTNDKDLEGHWQEYRRLVISELERIDHKVDEVRRELREEIEKSEKKILDQIEKLSNNYAETRDAVVGLQARAGIIGFLAGLIPAIVALLMRE